MLFFLDLEVIDVPIVARSIHVSANSETTAVVAGGRGQLELMEVKLRLIHTVGHMGLEIHPVTVVFEIVHVENSALFDASVLGPVRGEGDGDGELDVVGPNLVICEFAGAGRIQVEASNALRLVHRRGRDAGSIVGDPLRDAGDPLKVICEGKHDRIREHDVTRPARQVVGDRILSRVTELQIGTGDSIAAAISGAHDMAPAR